MRDPYPLGYVAWPTIQLITRFIALFATCDLGLEGPNACFETHKSLFRRLSPRLPPELGLLWPKVQQ
jgi:hypothetical protein